MTHVTDRLDARCLHPRLLPLFVRPHQVFNPEDVGRRLGLPMTLTLTPTLSLAYVVLLFPSWRLLWLEDLLRKRADLLPLRSRFQQPARAFYLLCFLLLRCNPFLFPSSSSSSTSTALPSSFAATTA